MKNRLKISGNTSVQQARRTCKTLALDESRNKDPIRFSPAYADKRTNVLAKYNTHRSIFSRTICCPLGNVREFAYNFQRYC